MVVPVWWLLPQQLSVRMLCQRYVFPLHRTARQILFGVRSKESAGRPGSHLIPAQRGRMQGCVMRDQSIPWKLSLTLDLVFLFLFFLQYLASVRMAWGLPLMELWN